MKKLYPFKHYMKFLLSALILVSCTVEEQRGVVYNIGKDGLIYDTKTNQLYTGKITDTADVIIEMDVVNGKKHGTFTTHYLNGNIEKQGSIRNNRNEGEWKYYYEDGSLELVGNFKQDKPEGIWIYYHQNGIKKEEGAYKEGKRTGRWIIYDEKGEVTNELDFESGEILKEKEIKKSSLITSLN